MIIDLQRFKRINDTLGRHAGDRVLKELANRLQRTISESATPARIGGDRFAVVLPNLEGASMRAGSRLDRRFVRGTAHHRRH